MDNKLIILNNVQFVAKLKIIFQFQFSKINPMLFTLLELQFINYIITTIKHLK